MRVKLEELVEEVSERTTINNQHPVLTSSRSGIYLQEDYFKKQVASKDNTGYRVIRKGEFTYRAMSDTGEFYPNKLECTDIGIVSPAYPVFKIKDYRILPDYLKYYFKSRSFQKSITAFVQGSTRASMKFGKMKSISIDLPDEDKQNQILNTIGILENIIDKYELEIDHLNNLIKARFVEMFGNYTMEKTIGEVATICRGASPRPISKFITKSNGENWIKIGDAKEDDIYITKTKELVTEDGANRSRRIKPGDFILSNSMSFGRPYISKIYGCVHDGWLIVSDYEQSFLPLFFYYAIRSELVQAQFRKSVAGAVVKNLNSDLVRSVKIVIPSIESQEKFSSFAKQIDKSKFAVQKSLEKTQLLFDSLMQEYFD